MAYQTQGRDPLLDAGMQAAIERRGRELLGLILFAVGVVAALTIASYSPDDPNWMVATDAPVQNWMGRFGAALAAPVFMVMGWGAFGFGLLLMVWGVRVTLDRGAEYAVPRLIWSPVPIVLASIFAATLTPPGGWSHSFGLGGLFGDTVLMMVLQIVPGSAALGAKLLALGLGAVILLTGAFALGFTWREIGRLVRWLTVGTVLLYAAAIRFVGVGASAGAGVARGLAERRAATRAARAETELMWSQHDAAAAGDLDAERQRVAQVIRSSPMVLMDAAPGAAHPMAAPEPLPEPAYMPDAPTDAPRGLRALVGLRKRDSMPEPEMPQMHVAEDYQPDVTPEDRLRSKIATVVTRRNLPRSPAPIPRTDTLPPRVEPTLTRGRVEPPLTATSAAAGQMGHYVPQEAMPREDLPPPPEAAAPEAFVPPMAPVMEVVPTEAVPAAAYAPRAVPDPVPHPDPAPLEEPVAEVAAAPAPRLFTPKPARPVVQHPPRKAPQPSTQARAEAQPPLAFEDAGAAFECPPLSLLSNPVGIERHTLSDEALEENARMLTNVLDDYGVKGEIVNVRPGPVVTMYELEPAPGLKASRVIGLADDIARSMSALAARVSTVPGRSVIGIELPNENREKVVLREILSHRSYGDGQQRLPLALGKDIGGEPVVANLAKMPHLLIAGTTGSGKSVAINTMILSLLYKLTPEECRLIMIDPKMLELSVYDGIPHLLSPVVTDPKKAVVALKWVVGEMEDRYRKMSKMGVRNIEGYNGRVREALSKGEMFSRTVQTGFDDETGEPVWETDEFKPEVLPFIVVVVDEMADLMMVAGKEIEACIQRLAQMARASGIHLIMATQRPSVDVITGTIKANFPTRISFQVTSKVDSRTILGEMGAEQLLGMGDMLYMAGGGKISRVHGPFVSDEEVEEIVNHLKAFGPPDYVGGVVEGPEEEKEANIDAVLGLGGNTDGEDALYDQAVAIVAADRKCSTSYIQRKLAIGYNKAARLVEQMEEQGVVSPANHVGKREVLVPEA
ncbi:MAG: DNA translocase FtsK 4TM domain-containing protein [Shimia sp.]